MTNLKANKYYPQQPEIMPVTTDICFKIIGANDEVFQGQSEALSTTDLVFNTQHPLKRGMLLQMTMVAKESNSPSLQTIVEVTRVEPLGNAPGFHVDSSIKDIAIGM